MIKITKIILAFISLFIILVLGFFIYKFDFINSDNDSGVDRNNKKEISNLYDGTYKIGDEKVTIKNGLSLIPMPGQSSGVITKYWGNDVRADLDSDGTTDTAFMVTQQTGGSGTFYYVTALLNTSKGKVGVDGVLLGDRIAPQNMNMETNNILDVNYADRATGESFAVQPSMGKTIRLKLDSKTLQFGVVANNFEGEADPSKMTLNMKTWTWVKTTYNNDTETKLVNSDKFSIAFKDNKTFGATTDCNGVGGNYSVNSNQIIFEQMVSTLMYCDGSKEGEFTKMLGEVESYLFTSKGELILNLKSDGGSMIFQ